MGAQTASGGTVRFKIEVEPSFAPYMADAAARLSYVEQDFSLEVVGSDLLVTAATPVAREAIVRKIHHALYREKIRVESAPLRARFLDLMAQR